jgi:hypothetical protein
VQSLSHILRRTEETVVSATSSVHPNRHAVARFQDLPGWNTRKYWFGRNACSFASA